MMNSILLVDENDHIIGTDSKENCHLKGLLHRAFSIFIYCQKTNCYLLQKRSQKKYHSGGLWTNTCCSHPISEESLDVFMKKRLWEELGLTLHVSGINYTQTLKKEMFNFAGKFHYTSKLGRLWENEIDYVFVLFLDSEQLDISHYNEREVSDLAWEFSDTIEKKYKMHPEMYTAWFYSAYLLAKRCVNQLIV